MPLKATAAEAWLAAAGIGWVEGWRGEVLVALHLDADGRIARCHCHDPSWQNWPVLIGQSLFILFFSIIALTVSVYGERQRRQTYTLQTEVQRQKDELLAQNRALADIKGQLIQREKMAALGTLSAGLLHELNNPVNYSLMAINMAQQLPAAHSDGLLAESLADAKEGMSRVQAIVTDLKTFAYQKPGENNLRPFLLEQAIRSAQRLAGHELKGVQVNIDQPQDTHVLGDEPAIIGVLINLFSNAALALQRAGREQPRIDVRVTERGDRLHVAVRDNGQGILPEHIGRVFEPFFTTRDVGAGLGLGLLVAAGRPPCVIIGRPVIGSIACTPKPTAPPAEPVAMLPVNPLVRPKGEITTSLVLLPTVSRARRALASSVSRLVGIHWAPNAADCRSPPPGLRSPLYVASP